jgi:hypothetical protein
LFSKEEFISLLLKILSFQTVFSYITLQRFFDNSYKASALNDLRFIKTLYKLCIFLGHYDLNEYILNSKQLTISDDDSKQIDPYRKIIETFSLKPS